MITIESPNISAESDREQLLQMRSYLYRMAQQLQWAFDSIQTSGTGSGTLLPAVTASGVNQQTAAKASFGQLKDLIIKSADIVNAYYAQISRKLEGKYVAQSDFGEYLWDTSLTIEETPTSVGQIFRDLQEISGSVTSLVESNAYIRSGHLADDDNGYPIYGLEVGQTNEVDGHEVFSKFARFTSEKLSFYDANSTEVAFVSNSKLYITDAEIGRLRIGSRFKLSYDGGLMICWTGGDS